jgi:hypothetical protein
MVMLITLIVSLSIYIPIRYQTPYPKDIRPQFDDYIRNTYLTVLNETQPDLVLLGDSMLRFGVDDKALADQLDNKIYFLSLDGTASTIWYLIIKNNLVVAAHKPEYLIIFFRDSMMTVPSYRVTGRYFELVDEVAGPLDEVLIQRAYIDKMNPLEKLTESYLPIYGSRWRIRESLDYYVRYSAVRVLLGCDQSCMDNAMENVFDDQNMDQKFLSDAIAVADDFLYSEEALDFKQQIGNSFLPEIIRLCKENGIQLVLVRMPIRRFHDPGTEPAGLNSYMQNLENYLKENGVIYVDVDREKDMPITYFEDALHLNETGRIEFTRRLVEALKPVIR